jgi:hypothetical protein
MALQEAFVANDTLPDSVFRERPNGGLPHPGAWPAPQARINQPLGLTVYCWRVRLDQFA